MTRDNPFCLDAIFLCFCCIFLGKDTTHCTNGIIIQRKVPTRALPPKIAVDRCVSKKRSISHISANVLPYYQSRHEGQSQIDDKASVMLEEDHPAFASAKLVDFGWIFLRQPFEDTPLNFSEDAKQVIPAWTSFNIHLQEKKALRECCTGADPGFQKGG